jgi:hemerythrin-like domain-containing protein
MKPVMTAEQNPLTEAFVSDHRQITRRLSRLLKAVRDGDFEQSREIAVEVNRLAGPHIQFEEEFLYPHIARLLGRDYAVRLYEEHEAGRSVLKQLTRGDRATGFAAGEREALERLLGTAVEHAATCATLVSRMAEAPFNVQASMRAGLDRCRAAGLRWTELPRDAAARIDGVE